MGRYPFTPVTSLFYDAKDFPGYLSDGSSDSLYHGVLNSDRNISILIIPVLLYSNFVHSNLSKVILAPSDML